MYHHFTTAHRRLKNLPKPDEANVYRVHKNCRINFTNHFDRLSKNYTLSSEAIQEPEVPSEEAGPSTESPITPVRTRRSVSDIKENKLCFVCDTRTDQDNMRYNEGGLGRCTEDSAKMKLNEALRNIIFRMSETSSTVQLVV